jgi:hypothetical protein
MYFCLFNLLFLWNIWIGHVSILTFDVFFRKWILAQLKPSLETADDLLENENQRSQANDTPLQQRGAYDISDDEGSSDSENDQQPTELDDAAKARS